GHLTLNPLPDLDSLPGPRRSRFWRLSLAPVRTGDFFSMLNRSLVREFDVSGEDWAAAIGDSMPDEAGWLVGGDVGPNQVVDGKVRRVDDESVLVDVGYKSEGIIPRNEWEEGEALPEVGYKIRVLVEDTEDIQAVRQDDRGMIVLSKRKAEKIEKWLKVIE